MDPWPRTPLHGPTGVHGPHIFLNETRKVKQITSLPNHSVQVEIFNINNVKLLNNLR